MSLPQHPRHQGESNTKHIENMTIGLGESCNSFSLVGVSPSNTWLAPSLLPCPCLGACAVTCDMTVLALWSRSPVAAASSRSGPSPSAQQVQEQ